MRTKGTRPLRHSALLLLAALSSTSASACFQRVQQPVGTSEFDARSTPAVLVAHATCIDDVLVVRIEDQATCSSWMFQEHARPAWQASESTASWLSGALEDESIREDRQLEFPEIREREAPRMDPRDRQDTEWRVSIDSETCTRPVALETAYLDGVGHLTDLRGQLLISLDGTEQWSLEVRGERWLVGCRGAVPQVR